MRSSLPLVRASVPLLGVCIILALPAVAWPQGQLGTKEALKKAYAENSFRRDQLFAGNLKAEKGDMKIAEAAANYFIYRVTHSTENPTVVHNDFNKAIASMVNLEKGKSNQDWLNLFGPACVESIKQILERDVKAEPGAVINAAMMLQQLGKLKQANINNYLIDLVKYEKYHDAIRVYAFKGLREAMPVLVQPSDLELDLNDKAFQARVARDVKVVEALTTYIEKPIKVNNMSAEEIAAVRFVRREAISALANAGSPAVLAFPTKGTRKATLQGPVAPTLMRVLTPKTELLPTPNLTEKIEAAVGLCNMKYPNMPEYNKDVAVYLVGQTLVEFVREYNKDRGNFTGVGVARTIPYLGWKTDSRRLEAGLKELAKDKASPSAQGLEARAKVVLDSIIKHEAPDRIAELQTFVDSIRPKAGNVFKTVGGAVIAY